MTWTRFMDMHSGGGRKGPADKILIEAPEDEARVIFYNRFGHNPERVTCTCCGSDYSISEEPTLEEATAYDRGCAFVYFFADDGSEVPGQTERWSRPGVWDRDLRADVLDGRVLEGRYVERGYPDARSYNRYRSLEDYLSDTAEVLVVRGDQIKDEERVGSVPEQGYVWMD